MLDDLYCDLVTCLKTLSYRYIGQPLFLPQRQASYAKDLPTKCLDGLGRYLREIVITTPVVAYSRAISAASEPSLSLRTESYLHRPQLANGEGVGGGNGSCCSVIGEIDNATGLAFSLDGQLIASISEDAV